MFALLAVIVIIALRGKHVAIESALKNRLDTFSCKRKDVGTHGIEAVQSLSRVWLHET